MYVLHFVALISTALLKNCFPAQEDKTFQVKTQKSS